MAEELRSIDSHIDNTPSTRRQETLTKLFISRVIRTLNWRLDVQNPEMIEQRANGMQYCRDHLSQPGSISQDDLDSICDVVNDTFKKGGSHLRVGNNMGELIPGRCRL